MAWYYMKDLERIGPIDDAQFANLIAQGVVTARTWVWRAGMKDWKAYHDIAAEIVSSQAESDTISQPQAVSTVLLDFEDSTVERSITSQSFGGIYDQENIVQNLPLNEYQGTTTVACVRFAGIWIRFCAQFCDVWLVGLVLNTSGKIFGFRLIQDETINSVVLTVGIAFYIAYETWMVGKYGATLGKMALGLRVVQSDGSPLTYMRAFARYWAKVLSGLLLCIGFIMAAFDSQKRGLHDRICGTRVIRTR